MGDKSTKRPWGQGCGQSNRFIYKHLAPGEGENECVARCATPEDAALIVSSVNALDGLNPEAVVELVEWAEVVTPKVDWLDRKKVDGIFSRLRTKE